MNVGVHIRLTNNLLEVVERAQKLQTPVFQTFFVIPKQGLYRPGQAEKEFCIRTLETFNKVYLHISYFTNLAAKPSLGISLFEQEIELALALGITNLVLHPGARSGSQTHQQALSNCSRELDKMLKKYPAITVLLENCAHGNRAIGGALEDLSFMLSYSNRPEQIGFCIDTAHAFAWGYEINEHFCQELKRSPLWEKIQLIHFNDSYEKRGSKLDRHAAPGQGLIGKAALDEFRAFFRETPKIIELAKSDEDLAPTLLQTLYAR